MLRFVGQRLLTSIPLLGLVSLGVFALVFLIPGDPAQAMLGEGATPEAVAALREQLGLNDPLPVQFARWLANALHGDLGTSYVNHSSVVDAVLARAPVTVALVLSAMLLGLLAAVPLGLVAAYRRDSVVDHALSLMASLGIALPEFWFGAILILFVALKLRLLPGGGFVNPSQDLPGFLVHLILPGATLALPGMAELFRQTRAGAIDVLNNDYIRTARACGLPARSVLFKHVAKNALVPVITVLGLQPGRLTGAAALTESIFGMQGVGSLAVSAALSSDLPTIQGIVLLTASIVLLANLLVDASYFYLNPRLRSA